MERTRGESEMRSEGGDIHSHGHIRSGPDPARRHRSKIEAFTHTAGDWAGRARYQLDEGVSRVRDLADARPDFAAILREKPLSLLGLAFSAGFFIALTTGGGARLTWIDRVRRQMKAVIVTGITAAAVQELRDLIDEEDLDELMAAWSRDTEPDEL